MLWGCLGDTWGQYIYYNVLKRLKMAIIKSGFLMGLYRSSSGMTFYKRRGTPSVRSKPVRSLNWSPSVRQTYFQIIFSAVNDYIKSETWMLPIINGGWGWSRKHNSSSNLNNIIGYIIRTISRREGGERRPIDEVNALGNAFMESPLKFFAERCQLTASKYPIAGKGQIVVGEETEDTFQMSYAECMAWYEKVCNMEGAFRSTPKFYFFISTGGDGNTLSPNISLYGTTISEGMVKTQIDKRILSSTVYQVCLAINAGTDEIILDPNLWAISPVVATNGLISNIPPYTPMSISTISVDGVVRSPTGRLIINTGQNVEISGEALRASEILIQFFGSGGSSGVAFRLTSLMDVTTDTPKLVAGTWKDAFTRRIENFERSDGTVLIAFPFS